MKIAIAGAGYVGLSLGVLLSQNHEVVLVDIVPEKIEKINKKFISTPYCVLLFSSVLPSNIRILTPDVSV